MSTQAFHRVSVVAIHRQGAGELHCCSSWRVSDPGSLLAQAPGPAELQSPLRDNPGKFDVEDHTRDPAREAINEAKIRLEQAVELLDRYPDNVLALESAIVQARSAIVLLECPPE